MTARSRAGVAALIVITATVAAGSDEPVGADIPPRMRRTQVWLGPEAASLRGEGLLGGACRISSELPFEDASEPPWSGSVYAFGGRGGGHEAFAILIGFLKTERLGLLRYGAGLDLGYARLSDVPGLVAGPRAMIGLDLYQSRKVTLAIQAHAAVQTPRFYHGGIYLTFWSPLSE